MRSSSGEYFLGLDHVRALAALMVFSWHFVHAANGYPVPFAGAPALFPLALLDEGHTGVSLFMTLSGYLFAKLLDGRAPNYSAFLWNRFVRLAPLFFVALVIAVFELLARGTTPLQCFKAVILGAIFPSLPNGLWSITVECHFYLLLPLILFTFQRYGRGALCLLVLPLLLRVILYDLRGEIQFLSYRTLIGRIDQFVLGIGAHYLSSRLKNKHVLATGVGVGFAALYWLFDARGGFYELSSYPSRSPIWIVMPTFEGAAYALLIAYYDRSFAPKATGLSRFVAQAGAYSYSIYLLHFLVVFKAADLIHRYVMPLSNWYVAEAWAVVCFILMMPVGYLSFRFIESPFLKYRRRYVVPQTPRRDGFPAAQTVQTSES